jgi:hypothetical protein
MSEDRWTRSCNILLEGHANTANVQYEATSMLSQHLQMGVAASH